MSVANDIYVAPLVVVESNVLGLAESRSGDGFAGHFSTTDFKDSQSGLIAQLV